MITANCKGGPLDGMVKTIMHGGEFVHAEEPSIDYGPPVTDGPVAKSYTVTRHRYVYDHDEDAWIYKEELK